MSIPLSLPTTPRPHSLPHVPPHLPPRRLAWLRQILARALAGVQAYLRQRRERTELACMDSRALRDIGLTPGDAKGLLEGGEFLDSARGIELAQPRHTFAKRQ